VIMSGASANSSRGCTAEREDTPPSLWGRTRIRVPYPEWRDFTIERFVERIILREASLIRAFFLSFSFFLSFILSFLSFLSLFFSPVRAGSPSFRPYTEMIHGANRRQLRGDPLQS